MKKNVVGYNTRVQISNTKARKYLFYSPLTKKADASHLLFFLLTETEYVLRDLRVIARRAVCLWQTARWELRPAATGGRCRQGAISAAVEKQLLKAQEVRSHLCNPKSKK